uniref:thiol oxidase n=1 Tax=viral metagenome TaxID=1070528 RepID=A0A6C0D3R7_9ZZZZ
MQFSNTFSGSNNGKRIPSMLIMSKPPILPKKTVQENIAIETPNINQPKKMTWGEPTWFLFHTLAEKVKEDRFGQIRVELFNNILAICNVLPCPICAQHATEYMRRIQLNSIKCKQDLKDVLFQFHNEVNKRKGVPVFLKEDLDDKYSKANTTNIIQYFVSAFQQKSNNVSAIATDMYKMRILQLFKKWILLNLQNFEQ